MRLVCLYNGYVLVDHEALVREMVSRLVGALVVVVLKEPTASRRAFNKSTLSIILWMPSWGGMINGVMTLSGAWDKLRTDPVLRMMVVSLAFYGMATSSGAFLFELTLGDRVSDVRASQRLTTSASFAPV